MTTKKTTKTAAAKGTKLQQLKTKKSSVAARKAAGKTQVRLSRAKSRLAKDLEAKKTDKTSRKKVKTIGHAPHSARITAPKGVIQPIASRTLFGVKNSSDRKWVVVDAAGQTVGRIASQIANLLRGKHKATYTPNNDEGDFVIVINAEKVKFKSTKDETKQYHHHSGYIGGLKSVTPARLRETFPDRIILNAVKGMVPRNPLGRDQMRKLKIYAGDQHPHIAQAPVAWNIRHDSNA